MSKELWIQIGASMKVMTQIQKVNFNNSFNEDQGYYMTKFFNMKTLNELKGLVL